MGYAIQDLSIEKIDKLFDGLLKKHNNLNKHDFRNYHVQKRLKIY